MQLHKVGSLRRAHLAFISDTFSPFPTLAKEEKNP